MKKNTTKRSLLASVLALVMCVTMLVGTTFAWFTDSASTSVNRIEAGSLQVEIQGKDGKPVEELKWLDKDGKPIADQESIFWEPNCTYNLTPFKIVNTGNLALKYKVVVTGLNGDSELLDVISFSYKIGDKTLNLDEEGHLAAMGKEGNSTEFITISAHMDAEAGNKYMGKTLEGVKFTVYAAQDTVESDSKDNKYDEKAEYAVPVSTVDELEDAIKNGKNVVLKNDLNLTAAFAVPSNKTVAIDLNGKTVTAEKDFATVKEGSKLTVNGGTVIAKNYVFRVTDGEVVVNGGDFTAKETACALFGGSKLTVNGGTFTSMDNNVVATNGSESKGCEITINGGVFNGNIKTKGYIACGVYVANDDTVMINGGTFNIVDGVGILMRAGKTTIGKDVVINLTNTGTVTSGKVGDAVIDITTPSHLVVDLKSKYPALGPDFSVTNNSSYSIVEYK